jgi:hypothetical protein
MITVGVLVQDSKGSNGRPWHSNWPTRCQLLDSQVPSMYDDWKRQTVAADQNDGRNLRGCGVAIPKLTNACHFGHLRNRREREGGLTAAVVSQHHHRRSMLICVDLHQALPLSMSF